MDKLCPDCCMDFETDKDRLRCCLDHLTPPEEIEVIEGNAWAVWGKEIEEYAWNLWEEVKAYKAGAKTLQAEKAKLEISLRAERAVVKEMVAGLTEISEGLEGLKG